MSYRAMLIAIGIVLACSSHAELMAGVARADITPPLGGPMGGYGARGSNVSDAVHDPLYAKALVLKDSDTSLAIVTLDLVGFPGDSVDRVKAAIADKTGIEQVMLLSSHTHSGPDARADFPSEEKPWHKDAESKIVAAVVEAQGSLVPATYGVGSGELAEGHNRRKVAEDGTTTMFWENRDRVPTSPVDYEVGVIRFETADGEVLATLVNFTCHPVVLGPENLAISADFPGVMAKQVEEAQGGMCLFANGACGDINPYWDKTPPDEGAFEEMTRMGKALADEVLRVSDTIEPHESAADLTAQTEVLEIGPRWDYEDPDVREVLYKRYPKAMVDAYLSRYTFPMMADLVTVTLGEDLAFVGLPGEFFVEHGLTLKEKSVIPHTYAFGYCNEGFGYFPTINAAWQGGYGAKEEATVVEVGAGERFVNEALINLYYQTGRLNELPE
jgi:neutral ceramidase